MSVFMSSSGSSSSQQQSIFWRVATVYPSVSDIPAQEGALWLNTSSGEICVFVGVDANGNAKWYGQKGFVPTLYNVVDYFGDNSGICLFPFDDNILDIANNFSGSWSGQEMYSNGIVGSNSSANFDGTNTINVISQNNLQVPFSITFWIYPKSGSTETIQRVVGWKSASVPSDGNFCWCVRSSTAGSSWKVQIDCFSALHYTSTITVNLDEWSFFGVVFTSSSVSFYVKNISLVINRKETLGLSDSLVASGSNKFGIGSIIYDIDSSGNSYYAQCLVDHFRIFNRALSDTEIEQLFALESS